MPITSVSQEDILSWSRTALDKRRVTDLDTFIRLCNLELPAVGAASRGSRRGNLVVNKEEKISVLLAHKDSIAAAGGGDAAAATATATAAGLSQYDIAQYRAAPGDAWTLATILNVGNLGASPIFQLRFEDGSTKDAVSMAYLRSWMHQLQRRSGGQPNAVRGPS